MEAIADMKTVLPVCAAANVAAVLLLADLLILERLEKLL